MSTTYVYVKDMNTEAHRALTVIKGICEHYEGHCKSCPIGCYDSKYPNRYECALSKHTPRFMTIQDVQPFRLVEHRYKEPAQNDKDTKVVIRKQVCSNETR